MSILIFCTGLAIGTLVGMTLGVGMLLIPATIADRHASRRIEHLYPIEWKKEPPLEESPEEHAPTKSTTTQDLEDLIINSVRVQHTLHRTRLASMGEGTSPNLPAIHVHQESQSI